MTPNINISKQEALILIRLGRLEEAKESLIAYKNEVNQKVADLTSIKNETYWAYNYSYLNNEIEWASKMIYKVNKL